MTSNGGDRIQYGVATAETPRDVYVSPRGTRRVRRIHVHRRPRRRWLYLTLALVGIFTIIGLLTDALYPRSFSAADLRVLTSLESMPHASCRQTHPSRTQVYTLHGGGLVTTRLLCWTPVEQITIVQHNGPSRDVLLPASWASIRWLPISGDVNLTLEPSSRFRAVRAHISDGTVLEYAVGFMPALMLQRGALEAVVSWSPLPLLAACNDVAVQWRRYNAAVVAPALGRGASNVLGTFANIIDAPFFAARQLALEVRERHDPLDSR